MTCVSEANAGPWEHAAGPNKQRQCMFKSQVVIAVAISLLGALGSNAQGGCQRQANSVIYINITYRIPNTNLYAFLSDSADGYRDVNATWSGTEEDCCAACCQYPGCQKAVYWYTDGDCGLMAFDAGTNSSKNGVVLSGCVAPPPMAPPPPLGSQGTQTNPQQPTLSPGTSPAAPSGQAPGSGTSKAPIIGGIVAGAILLVLLAALLLFAWRRKRHTKAATPMKDATPTHPSAANMQDAPYPAALGFIHSPSPEPLPPASAGGAAMGFPTPQPPAAGSFQYYPEQQSAQVPLGPNASLGASHASSKGSASQASNLKMVSAPPSSMTMSSTASVFRLEECQSELEVLEMQLKAMRKQGPLLGRYKLGDESECRVGGQGIVQFASLIYNTRSQYAIKFFLDRAAFETEQAHFRNPELQRILPVVDGAFSNDDHTLMVLGRPLPPLLALEKGESLQEWAHRSKPDFASAMNIILHLTRRCLAVHQAGVVHRDLKPGNVIFYPTRNEWTVIDFGAAGRIGSEVPLVCSISYAAPETVIQMAQKQRRVIADPAVDVWALGVISFEVLARTQVFPPGHKQSVIDAMVHQEALPWERRGDAACETSLRRLGWMRDTILRMLHRDPAARISLAEVSNTWRTFLQQESSTIQQNSLV